MDINVISYNLRFHQAYPELVEVAKQYDPDILCLQECKTSAMADRIGHLGLAALTETAELGLAIYVRSDRFTAGIPYERLLPKSLHERSLARRHSYLLAIELLDKTSQQAFCASTLHAAAYASAGLRRKQVRAALHDLDELAGNKPTFLIGDYNYAFRKQGLRKVAADAGFELALPEQPTYKSWHYQGVLDFISTRNLAVSSLETLPFSQSDHAAIRTELTTEQA